MSKSVYVVVHVDYPEDELILDIVDPSAEDKPDVYLSKPLAEEQLKLCLERGLEYTLKEIVLAIK